MGIRLLIVSLISTLALGATFSFHVLSNSDLEKLGGSRIKKTSGNFDNWPETSQVAIRDLTKKYGKPDEITESKVIWYNNGPWKRTVIYGNEARHNFPVDHSDVIEQTIDYSVPPDKFDDLARFNGSIIVRRTEGEISIKCDRESVNFLAINLAHEIIRGKKTAETARSFYTEAIKTYALKSKMSPYMQFFLFPVKRGGTNETDNHGVNEEDNRRIINKLRQPETEIKEREKAGFQGSH